MKKILATLALWLIYVPAAHAQLGTGMLKDVGTKSNLGTNTNLPEIIGNIVRVFIGMLGLIFLVLTIYAGFLYLTARGEEEKVKHAKETLQRGVIGLIIITAAYAIATFVIGAITTTTAAST